MLTKNIVHDQLFFMFGEGRLLFKQELFSHVARASTHTLLGLELVYWSVQFQYNFQHNIFI